MNDMEDRLRDGYQVVAQAIRPETIRTHVLPAGTERPRSTRFVPLAAAAAMIAVIAGAVTVPRLLTHPPAATHSATITTVPSTTAKPPYFADLFSQWIEVRDRATGKVLIRVPPPADSPWQALAAVDGGTKFLVETSSSEMCSGRPFEMYTLTPGNPGDLKPYMTLPGFIEEFTASADGSTLAYLTYPCKGGRSEDTETLSVVRNGAIRDWTVPSPVAPYSLSLSADGSELGYVNTTNQAQRGTASVLSTSSPPGSLARWSRPVFVSVHHGQQAEALVLSPDGQTTYLLTAPADQSRPMTETLYAYDTATGTRPRTVHAWNGNLGYPVMVADGNHALISGLHMSSVDEVNLATGAATTFRQLADAGGHIFSIAW